MARIADTADDRPLATGDIDLMTRPAPVPPGDPLPEPPFHILRPVRQCAPLLVASPHSGRAYPAAFVAASRLDFETLRRSEDCFVDELLQGASARGIPSLLADFPRAYCDVNREPWELDPAMFADKLPSWCNTRTARVSAGFGTIARLVGSGQPIYADKLLFAEAEARVRACWQPYHTALSELIAETRQLFDRCVLLDCHSMPTDEARPVGIRQEPDFILGDAHGTSCDPTLPQAAQAFLERNGYQVRRNDPYAGGYVTRHYGRPKQGIHTLQIEISRNLYMDQKRYQRLPAFEGIQTLMAGLLQCLIDVSAQLPS